MNVLVAEAARTGNWRPALALHFAGQTPEEASRTPPMQNYGGRTCVKTVHEDPGAHDDCASGACFACEEEECYPGDWTPLTDFYHQLHQ
jgi:hypothetical protein